MRRALFVELLGGIGDLIFILPVLDRLREAHPCLEWDVFTFRPGAELLFGDSRVARVITATRPSEAPDREGATTAHPRFWFELSELLNERQYDLVVSDTRHSDIHHLIEESVVPRVVTQLWSKTTPSEAIPAAFVRRLREEGLISDTSGDARPQIRVSEVERARAIDLWRALGARRERAVVLNPNAGREIKRWARSAWARLAAALPTLDVDVVCMAENGSDTGITPVSTTTPMRILPRLPLRDTAACLEGIACLVSADSGIAHVGAAVGTPVVGLYGPTWAGRYGPAAPAINLQSPFDCPVRRPMNFTLQPCWAGDRCVVPGKRSCCDDLTVETVAQTIQSITAQSASWPVSDPLGESVQTTAAVPGPSELRSTEAA